MDRLYCYNMGISVICSTNRRQNMKNILENFLSQTYAHKELIVILNYNNPKFEKIPNEIMDNHNIQIHPLGAKYSLGKCLNFAIDKAKYPIIAKMDDDDLYAPNYLLNMIETFNNINAQIIGKSSIYIYFYETKILAIKDVNKENRFVNRVHGSTLMVKHSIFQDINFRDRDLGEDMCFCNDCIEAGYKIYSTSNDDYIYVRKNKDLHTWKMDNEYILNRCKVIGKIEDPRNYLKWR